MGELFCPNTTNEGLTSQDLTVTPKISHPLLLRRSNHLGYVPPINNNHRNPPRRPHTPHQNHKRHKNHRCHQAQHHIRKPHHKRPNPIRKFPSDFIGDARHHLRRGLKYQPEDAVRDHKVLRRGAEAEFAAGDDGHVFVEFGRAVVSEGGGDDDVGVLPDQLEAEDCEVADETAFGKGGMFGVELEAVHYVVVSLKEVG